jgi:chromatin segregation and condensation protein Rec8/ScpA/Scc1 (kleisin family)
VTSAARLQVRRLEKEQAELESEYSATVSAQIAATARNLPTKPYLDRMEEISRRLTAIAEELPEVQAEARADVDAMDSVRELLEELSAIAEGWETATPLEKRRIFAQWIDSLSIVVEPTEKGTRAAKRSAVLSLRIGPAEALIDLDGPRTT